MRARIRVKLEMGAGVRDFLRNHPLTGLGFVAAVVVFNALMDRASGHSSQQQEGLDMSRGATRRRDEIKDLLLNGLLRHFAGVGLVAARERPELGPLFRLPQSKVAYLTFVTVARRFLAEAEANKEFLVSKGLGESAIEDLRKALEELDAIDASSHLARSKHVGARADLDAVAEEIMQQVKLLDGTVRYVYRDNPEVLAAWRSARTVKSLSARKTDAPVASTPAPAPAAAA